MRPSIHPNPLQSVAMNSGGSRKALGERVRDSSALTTPEAASIASTGSHGAIGIASSGLLPPTPTNEITRNGANTTISATRVVCATMIGSSWAP